LLTDLSLSLALDGDFDTAVSTMRAAASAPGATAQHRQNLALVLGLAGRDDDALKVAMIDLDERSARSNLGYYAQLRASPAKMRAEAILRPGARNGK
jgi:Flp pilus assembly protein TadD